MKPGDLVVTAANTRVVLSKRPVASGRVEVGLALPTELGLVLARELAADAEEDGRFPEVMVLFGDRFGWASAQCFRGLTASEEMGGGPSSRGRHAASGAWCR